MKWGPAPSRELMGSHGGDPWDLRGDPWDPRVGPWGPMGPFEPIGPWGHGALGHPLALRNLGPLARIFDMQVHTSFYNYHNFHNLVKKWVWGWFWTDLDSGFEFCVKNYSY